MEHIKTFFILFPVFANIFIIKTIGQVNRYKEEPVYSYYNLSTENWTSCDDFLRNTTFDPETVVDVDWKIFYFWHYSNDGTYIIRFSIPYPILVDRFRTELEDLKPPVNWQNAALFMETSIDFSALFIRTDKPGIFRMIPNLAFHYDNLPMNEFGFKLVYPGYLGLMNCKHRYCYALAPVDKMPTEKNIHEEAQRLGFRGDYNRSYLYEMQTSANLPIFEDDDIDKGPLELYDDDGIE